MAAKLKLNDDARAQILALCRAGMHPDRAFTAAGLSPSTLRKWRMYARKGKREAIAFCTELEQAIAQCEANDVLTTRRAAVNENETVSCPECGERVQLDPLRILAMARHVGAVQGIKTQQASIALQRLKLRFPRRWSERVVHTVEDEHNRLLDVAERVLETEAFELLLEAYLSETDGDEPPASSEGPEESGKLH
jgi:hypothetical protein